MPSSLTKLELDNVVIHAASHSLQYVSALTGLRQLSLQKVQYQPQQGQLPVYDNSLCLDQLTQLVELSVDLRMLPLAEDTVAPFSCLQYLQKLWIHRAVEDPELLIGAPSHHCTAQQLPQQNLLYFEAHALWEKNHLFSQPWCA